MPAAIARSVFYPIDALTRKAALRRWVSRPIATETSNSSYAMRNRRPTNLAQGIAVIAAVWMLSGGIATAAKPPKPTDKFYQHAIELVAKGDHKGAIIELKNALQADPRDLAARVLLGNTYLEIEDGASAAKEFLRARKDGAKDSFILTPLGRAYVLQGHYRKAIKELSAAGQNPTTASEIAVIKGDAHLALNELRDAEQSYLSASKMRPKDARPLIGLARVKLDDDDVAGARRYAKWALEADPKDPRAWYVQGEISEQLGETDAAIESYRRAIEIAPEFPRARLARAAILIDRRQYVVAEPDILEVRKFNPRNPRAAFLLSLVVANRGELQEAQNLMIEAERILKSMPRAIIRGHPPTALLAGVVSYFRKDLDSSYALLSYFLRRFPQHVGARKLLASILLTWNDARSALNLLEALAPRKSNDIDVLTMYGDALARVKRFDEANDVLDRAAKIVEPGSYSLFKLVTVQLGARRPAEAIKILEAEMKRNPKAIKAAIMLGTVHMRGGNFKAALKILDSVTDLQRNNAVAHNLAGGAHLGLGEVEAARKRYKAAIEAAPDYLNAIENLAKVEAGQSNFDEAVELFTTILEKDPKNGQAMISLAEIARSRKDEEEAYRWLEKARTSSRDAHIAALRLIKLFIRAGRAEDALLIAREIYGQRPENFEFLFALGRAQLAAKKVKQAAASFKNLAVRANEEKSADLLYRAAKWLRRAQDIQGAQETLLKSLSVDPKHIPSHVELFQIELSSGAFRAAHQRAKNIISLNPGSPVGYLLEGDVSMYSQRYQNAIQAYDEALQRKDTSAIATRAFNARRAARKDSFEFARQWAAKRPDEPAAQRMLATAYVDAGRTGEAIEIYEGLLQKTPENIALLNDLALLYQETGDERALEFAKRAYESSPTEPATMDTYGWILVRQGRVDEGAAILRNAKLRAPAVLEIRYHLAVALKALGDAAEAKRELTEALRTRRPFDSRDEAQALLDKLSVAPN